MRGAGGEIAGREVHLTHQPAAKISPFALNWPAWRWPGSSGSRPAVFPWKARWSWSEALVDPGFQGRFRRRADLRRRGLPSLNRISVGMPRTPNCDGVIGFSSIFTFTTWSLPASRCSALPAPARSRGTGRTIRPRNPPAPGAASARRFRIASVTGLLITQSLTKNFSCCARTWRRMRGLKRHMGIKPVPRHLHGRGALGPDQQAMDFLSREYLRQNGPVGGQLSQIFHRYVFGACGPAVGLVVGEPDRGFRHCQRSTTPATSTSPSTPARGTSACAPGAKAG